MSSLPHALILYILDSLSACAVDTCSGTDAAVSDRIIGRFKNDPSRTYRLLYRTLSIELVPDSAEHHGACASALRSAAGRLVLSQARKLTIIIYQRDYFGMLSSIVDASARSMPLLEKVVLSWWNRTDERVLSSLMGNRFLADRVTSCVYLSTRAKDYVSGASLILQRCPSLMSFEIGLSEIVDASGLAQLCPLLERSHMKRLFLTLEDKRALALITSDASKLHSRLDVLSVPIMAKSSFGSADTGMFAAASSLRSLELAGNVVIEDLSCFPKSLSVLRLEPSRNGRIESLSGIAKLTKLKTLSLDNGMNVTVEILDELERNDSITDLTLRGHIDPSAKRIVIGLAARQLHSLVFSPDLPLCWTDDEIAELIDSQLRYLYMECVGATGKCLDRVLESNLRWVRIGGIGDAGKELTAKLRGSGKFEAVDIT